MVQMKVICCSYVLKEVTGTHLCQAGWCEGGGPEELTQYLAPFAQGVALI